MSASASFLMTDVLGFCALRTLNACRFATRIAQCQVPCPEPKVVAAQASHCVQGFPEGWTRGCFPLASLTAPVLSGVALQDNHTAKSEVGVLSWASRHIRVASECHGSELR